MGFECIEVIKKKLSQEMSHEEFYVSLVELHKKYPMPGHNPSLTKFQLRNYREIQMTVKDRDTGVVYRDHLQPFNFQEAAEMFIRAHQEITERLPFKDDQEENLA
jgi:hypothetical protein